jgi:signal transduction histidine kinase
MPTGFNHPSMDAPAGGEQAARWRAENAWRPARFQIGTILTIGLSVVALLWCIVAVLIVTERHSAIQNASAEASNLSAAFQEEVSRTLASVTRAMDAVAERMRAAQGNFDIHDWATEIPMLAAATIQGTIIGPDGRLLSTTLDANPAPIYLGDRQHFRVHLDGNFKGVFVGKPVIGRVSGQATIQVTKRVDAADGSFLGVIVFSLAPDQLTSLHKTIDLGPRGRLVLVGTNDHIILARFGTGVGTGDLGGGQPIIAHTMPENAQVLTVIADSVVDHVSRLRSIRNVAGYPLQVVVALDLAAILEPVVARAWLFAASGVLATLMLVGLMALLAREIRRRTDREVKLGDEQVRLAEEIQQGNAVQARLLASEAKLRDFAEMASDWFWEQDAELRFTGSSTGGPAMSAGDPACFGKTPWEVYDTSEAPELWASHRRDLLARKPFRDFRHSRPAPGGTICHVSISGVPVFDEAGKFLGYRGTGRDITAKVEAEAELRRSKEQAEASNRAKSAFLATMSHELRTPLNAIIGFAELIHAHKNGGISEEYVEWAGDILAGGRHLLHVINNILELSKLESGRHDLARDRLDLAVIVRACIPIVRRQAEKNRVRIDCAIADGDVVLWADRRAIKQVMLNLIANAVKFSPGGGVVTIRAERTATGETSLVVADTGIGIEPALLPSLCDPFVQADASASRRYGGSGLGLAISSKLVALHNGTLTIASALGQGTTVWVTFPEARIVASRRQVEVTV